MKTALKVTLAIILIMIFASCVDQSSYDDNLNIVTSFYPMYVLTSNIIDGANGVTLTNLTSNQTGCLHDYQISTKDMIKLSHADILVVNGGGMESFIEKAVSLYDNLKVIDSSVGLSDEHNKTEHQDDGNHEHGENSHYWVSISLYIEQVKNVSNELCKMDFQNAKLYEENTNRYIDKLEKLKEKMHNALDNVAYKNIVTFHEAFEFFAEEFNLNIVTVIEREPGTYPSSGEVAKIIDMIKSQDVKAIFVEPQYSRTAADTIARETNIKVFTLDPIVTGDFDKDAYINIMENNLETLVEALS